MRTISFNRNQVRNGYNAKLTMQARTNRRIKSDPATAAALLLQITGREPKYFPVPVALMDGIIGIFDFLAGIFPGLAVRAHRGCAAWGRA